MTSLTARKKILMLCLLFVLVSPLIAAAQTKKPQPVKRAAASEPIVAKKYAVSAAVRPEDSSMAIRALVDVVKAMRNTPVTSMTVELMPGLALSVPDEPKPVSQFEVKPNPLLLWLYVDEKGAMRLNNEGRGNLANLAPMGNYLISIFSAREKNGVFREGKNEIEKTVWLSLHPNMKVSDLEKAAGMLQVAGCDQIIFGIDGPLIPERLELLEMSPFKPAGKP